VVRELLRNHAKLSDREVGRRARLSAAAVRRLRNEPQPASKAGRRQGVARTVAGLLQSARRAVHRVAGLLGRLLRRS
jgi:hypothetical protein